MTLRGGGQLGSSKRGGVGIAVQRDGQGKEGETSSKKIAYTC